MKPIDEPDDLLPVVGPLGHALGFLLGVALAGLPMFRTIRRWWPPKETDVTQPARVLVDDDSGEPYQPVSASEVPDCDDVDSTSVVDQGAPA